MQRIIEFADKEVYKLTITDILFIKNTTISLFTDNEHLVDKYSSYIWNEDKYSKQVNIVLPEHMIRNISVKSTL